MRWRGREKSENVEDRRREVGGGSFRFPFPRSGRGSFPGRGGRLRVPRGRSGGIGLVGLIIIVVIMLMLGIDPRVLFQGDGSVSIGERQQTRPTQISAEDREKGDFISVVLKTTEDFWADEFASDRRQYTKPKLVLFRGSIRSGCGTGLAQMGPFYCPLDQKIYIDLSFYDDLKRQFHAPGDFAEAYVIAHEVGHHVQLLSGTMEKVMQRKARGGEREGNANQVRMELQADCYAGLWASYARRNLDILDPGDIEEALTAAAAIGDDRIQKRTQGYVVPDAFTHGSSEQRVTWFRRGFESGRIEACNTFGGQF